MSTHTDDLDFVEKVVNGDGEAARLLLCRCQLWAGQVARMSGLPIQEWDDIGNESLLTALGQMRRRLFRGESSFQTWMEKIIHGKIANYWRALGEGKISLVPLESALDECPRKAERNAVSLIQSPVMRKSDEETRLMVWQALRTMPRQHATVLLLNMQEGYSTAEIGQHLDLPPGTVGRKLAEAKKQFQRFFSTQPGVNPPCEATQPATPEPQRCEQESPPSYNPVFLLPLPSPRLPNLRSVPRQSLTTPSRIPVSATPMNPRSVYVKSL